MKTYAMSIKKPEVEFRAKSAGHSDRLPPIENVGRYHIQSETNIKELEQKHALGLRMVQGIREELGFE
jgi:hypothetical protein